MNPQKTINELINNYKSSDCYELYDFMLKSKGIRYVFEDNFKELLNYINKYEKETTSRQKKFKDKMLSRIKSRNRLNKFIKYFHNYVASTYSLEEHYKEFLSSVSYKDIKKKFEDIYENPLRLFVFAVRTNITHYTIPPISIAVHHKRNKTSGGDVLFLTKGSFKISKFAILTDHHKATTTNGNRSDSKFIANDNKRKILYAYISKEFKSGSFIDLKEVVKKHYIAFLKHINKVDNELITIKKIGYNKTEKLHKEIIRKQSKL